MYIFLLGWSRYDHFAVLCELLPVAVPSLVLDLLAVSRPTNLGQEVRAALHVMYYFKCFEGTYSTLKKDSSLIFDSRAALYHFLYHFLFGINLHMYVFT